jgi:hypothetical protein
MTLDTRVYVLNPINQREVFLKCCQLLGVTEQHRCEDKQDACWNADTKEWEVQPGNSWIAQTVPDQGLPAWLMLHYRPDAPYRTAAEAAAHDDDICNLPGTEWYDEDDGPCDGSWHWPACWLEISFDTAYSYRDGQGRGCGDFHASLVAELGQWLDERGVAWKWKNEFTGDVHTGYEQLIELCSGGFEASAWFRTSVMPAIAASGGEVSS